MVALTDRDVMASGQDPGVSDEPSHESVTQPLESEPLAFAHGSEGPDCDEALSIEVPLSRTKPTRKVGFSSYEPNTRSESSASQRERPE